VPGQPPTYDVDFGMFEYIVGVAVPGPRPGPCPAGPFALPGMTSMINAPRPFELRAIDGRFSCTWDLTGPGYHWEKIPTQLDWP